MTRSLFLLVLLLFCFACSNGKKQANIVLIMADDLGYADIGCFGSDYIDTPVLDRLAAEGMKFNDYHANGPVCTPTRAALLTGNYQQRAGLEGVIYAALDKRNYGIADQERTIAEHFKDAGYATGIFGKWHLGYQMKYNPTFHGFDEFYGYVSGNVDYISHRDGAGLYDWWHNRDTSYEKGYVTDLITDHALKFIESNKNKPFFLYVPHEAPHFPYQGRNDKADRLPGVNFTAHGSRADKKAAYKEMIEVMDENIGRIVQKLGELELDKNTLVFFCSDNGATNVGNNGKLNGFKGSLWEGGHRVPAIARFIGRIKQGSSNSETILSMDLLPMLLSVAGIPNNMEMDGKDFSSVMFEGKKMDERPVFWRYRNQWVVRKGDWKYLRIKEKEFLFDLKNDIGESNNLVEKEKEIVDELKVLLADWEKELEQYELKTK